MDVGYDGGWHCYNCGVKGWPSRTMTGHKCNPDRVLQRLQRKLVDLDKQRDEILKHIEALRPTP